MISILDCFIHSFLIFLSHFTICYLFILMAVQAQYPSNILLLNRSGHEFSVQQQSGGGFIDQSHMFFNNDHMNNNNNLNNNPRKRGREVAAGPMNPFSLQMQMQTQTQTQTPQLIDLSQLHQPNVVPTGLRLSFADQQQNLQQAHHDQNHTYTQQQQQQQQQLNLLSNSSAFSSLVTDNFSTQIKRHREELEQFLQAQGEVLRCTLTEKTQRHYRELLGAAEESVSRRLKEKEAEVERAKRRNVELEERAAQVSAETHVWQAKARAQEATAASLQAQLQQAIMSGGGVVVAHASMRGDEELNCAGGVERQAEDDESAYVDPERVVGLGPGCKACRTHVASVVLLPCRHLCLCRECDRVAQACPLCLTVKNYSVEVFLS